MIHRQVSGIKSYLVNEGNFLNTIKIFNLIISHYPFQNAVFFVSLALQGCYIINEYKNIITVK